MTYSKDFWERVLRTFYTSAVAVGGPLVVAHLAGAFEDVAAGNWSALKSMAVTIGAASASAGWTAIKALVAKGLGLNKEDGSLRGAFSNGS